MCTTENYGLDSGLWGDGGGGDRIAPLHLASRLKMH